jgi:hypothetical protein
LCHFENNPRTIVGWIGQDGFLERREYRVDNWAIIGCNSSDVILNSLLDTGTFLGDTSTYELEKGHDYLSANHLCRRNLTDGEQRELLRRFGIPNTYTQGGDQGGDGLHVVATWLFPGGVVETEFASNGLSVTNTTTWFHAFVGVVDRSILNTSSGAYFMTHGYGNANTNARTDLYSLRGGGMFAAMDLINRLRDVGNQSLGASIFSSVDNQARRYAQHHFKGC